MDADDVNLKALLEGVKQFVAPAYQRRYTWTQPQWEALWRQLLRQHQALVDIREALAAGLAEPSLSTHFLGSFVLAPQPGPAAQLTRHQIVDGQQRLTTVSVLLAAIRDVVSDASPEEGERIASGAANLAVSKTASHDVLDRHGCRGSSSPCR